MFCLRFSFEIVTNINFSAKMENSGGKISFGFSKTAKKSNLVKTIAEIAQLKPKVELIDSIEGSSVTFLG